MTGVFGDRGRRVFRVRSGRPVAEQDAQVGPVDGSVAVEVRDRIGGAPCGGENRQVGTVDHAVVIEVAGDAAAVAACRERVVSALNWRGPVYEVSAVAGLHTDSLCGDLMTHLEAQAAAMRADPEAEQAEIAALEQMQQEARERIADLQAARAQARARARDGMEDDDAEVEVEYRH